jgi:hypothetical protein
VAIGPTKKGCGQGHGEPPLETGNVLVFKGFLGEAWSHERHEEDRTMKSYPGPRRREPGASMKPDHELPEDCGRHWLLGKTLLLVFPFALVALFLLLDWWLRGGT